MKVGWRVGFLVVVATLFIISTPSLAEAALSISVPASASLGSAATGTTSRSTQLGSVTVSSTGILGASFTVSVSCTDFTTGARSASETITKASISYWSGLATASTGLASSTPGQLTSAQAVNLSSARTAFSGTGALLSFSVSWNPTVVLNFPPAAVVGTYTGTITHSVA